jgi:hypothetical protein
VRIRGIAERSAGEDVELRNSVDEDRDEMILVYEGQASSRFERKFRYL